VIKVPLNKMLLPPYRSSNNFGVTGRRMVAMGALDGRCAGVTARALVWCVQIQEISAC
jgi:hypothetical protein